MEYGLIWVGALSSSLLLTAAATAHSARLKSRRWREAATGFFFSLPAAVFAVVGGAFYLLFSERYIPVWPFVFALSLFLLHAVGGGLILRKGLRAAGEAPQAGKWSSGILSLGFGLAIVFSLAAFWMTDLGRKAELARVNGDIRAGACSIYPSPIPQHSNAATVYQEAYNSLAGKGSLPHWLDLSDHPEHHVLTPGVIDFLKKHRAVIPLMRSAAAMPEFYLPFDGSRLVGASVHEVDIYWRLARFMAVDAAAKAEGGDSAGAMENLILLRAMMEHLLSVPEIVAFYAAEKVAGIGLQGVERLLARGIAEVPLPSRPLAVSPTRRPVLSSALRLEEFYDLEVNVMMAPGGGFADEALFSFDLFIPLSYPPIGRAIWRVFVMPGELACVRETWQRLHDLAAEPFYQNRPRLGALKKRFTEHPKGRTIEQIFQHRSRFIDGKCARLDAECRMADISLAVAAYLQDRGIYPVRVSDLVPLYLQENPVDPFVGKPFELKPAGGGLVLSSPGGGEEDEPIEVVIGHRIYQEKRVAPAKALLEKKKSAPKGKKRRRAKKPG